MTQNEINRVIKMVERFNADLDAYAAVSGEYELPEIDSTIIGYSVVNKYTYKVSKNGTAIKVLDCDGIEFDIPVIESVAYDELKEALKYDRRRLSKAWRVWKSENPDSELEKDEEEE